MLSANMLLAEGTSNIQLQTIAKLVQQNYKLK
jgi:hypothetical protein